MNNTHSIPGPADLPPGTTHRMIDAAMGGGDGYCSHPDCRELTWSGSESCPQHMADDERLEFVFRLAKRIEGAACEIRRAIDCAGQEKAIQPLSSQARQWARDIQELCSGD